MKSLLLVCFIALGIAIFLVPELAIAQTGPAPVALCGDPAALANFYSVPYPRQNSPALSALISCITTNIPNAAMIDMGQVYSFQQNPELINYTRGYRDCGLDVTCASLDCHALYSCHYGGRTGNQGAEAVDFNARAPFTENDLYTAIRTLVFPDGACFNLAKYVALEVDHTHVSTVSDVGCDATNIPITVGSVGPGVTTEEPGIVPESKPSKVFSYPALFNPLRCGDPVCIFTNVVQTLLGSIGVIGLIIFVYAGFTILTSEGNVERIDKGKKMLMTAGLGIVIILLSWAGVYFVLKIFFS